MKLKLGLIIVIAALVAFGLSGVAFAFHGGGVAQCEGCHTMHNSKDGVTMSRASGTYVTNNLVVGQAGAFLLQGTDQSSTCLNCHASEDTLPTKYHIASLGQPIPTERTPGGDFAWLKTKSSKKGHSIVAVDYGYGVETTKAGNVAPGGTYPVASLACSSCHDPHGKYRKLFDGSFNTTGLPIGASGSYGADPSVDEAVGSYRLLAGKLYLPKSLATQPALAFDEDPMHAAAPATYNASEATTEIIVNYGKGVGAWCQQCHPKMHMGVVGTGVNVHPNDQGLGSTVAPIYNNYVSSGNMQPGGGGFTSLIPVAYDNMTVNSTLAGHFTTGAQVATNDQVNCLSCHRAHASAFNYMLRFPLVEEMVIADAGGLPIYASGGRDLPDLTAADVQAGLYDRPASKWGVGQRTLCNKCHAKD